MRVLAVVLSLCVGPALACDRHDNAALAAPGGDANLYQVAVEVPPLAAGAEAKISFIITPGKGLKWNEEYPTSVRIKKTETATITFLRDRIKKGDPLISESKQRTVLRVPVRGRAAGTETVEVLVSFSVCTDRACHILRNRVLTAKVTVR